MLAVDGGDDRVGRTHRIAGLVAAEPSHLVETLVDRLRVCVDALSRGLERAPRPVGPEGSRLDDRDLDAERSDLLRQCFGQSYDAEFGGGAIGRTRVADEAADRCNVDDMA